MSMSSTYACCAEIVEAKCQVYYFNLLKINIKMGFIFSKPRDKSNKKEIVITEQDKAVLVLKQQRDKLKQYQKKVTEALDKDRLFAKQLLNDGKKDRAKLLLRKKRFMEQVLEKTDGQLLNLERMVSDLEFAEIETQVAKGLQVGNTALKKMHDLLSIEDIEKIMDETQEGVEKQREIDDLLSGSLTDEDEEAVLEELNKIIGESEPETEMEIVQEKDIELPDVPEHEPKVKEVAKRVKKEMLAAS